MTSATPGNNGSSDEAEIRELIARWAKAVREEDMVGMRADHEPEMLMFDVPPPFMSRGLDAYMATWKTFFSWSEKPVAFDFHDVEITAGQDVAFATAVGRCGGTERSGEKIQLEFRLTMGLRKRDGGGVSCTNIIHCRPLIETHRRNPYACRETQLRGRPIRCWR